MEVFVLMNEDNPKFQKPVAPVIVDPNVAKKGLDARVAAGLLPLSPGKPNNFNNNNNCIETCSAFF